MVVVVLVLLLEVLRVVVMVLLGRCVPKATVHAGVRGRRRLCGGWRAAVVIQTLVMTEPRRERRRRYAHVRHVWVTELVCRR